MNKEELGIYIHIPFCKQKCYYCDFISFSGIEEKETKYIEAIQKEINSYKFEKYCVTTIYLGGGTPSYLSLESIQEILKNLKEKLKNNEIAWEKIEITIEVNPGTATKEKLQGYKKAGINRLSIGLQAAQDRLLKQIGRIHTYKEFEQTYNWAKEVGFQNINVDLMLGLPNQSIQDLKESLEKVIANNPTHISTYSLIVEEGTILENKISKGELELPSEELERQMYWYVKNTLELNGYIHYEISNFAKKGKESKHNINCWKQKQYVGIGVAAHSYLNQTRYSNTENLEEYIANMKKLQDGEEELEKDDGNEREENRNIEKKNADIYEIYEKQTIEDTEKEYMLLGLRKIAGVSIQEFKNKFVQNPLFLFRNEIEKLTREGLIMVDGDFIRLTNKGIDFANLVWEEFV